MERKFLKSDGKTNKDVFVKLEEKKFPGEVSTCPRLVVNGEDSQSRDRGFVSLNGLGS